MTHPASDPEGRYISTPTGYLMVLRLGDNVFAQLERLARREQIPSASFTGLGFAHATFGFWDASKKAFDPRRFPDVEIGSMVGSVAWKEGEPSIHAHAVAAGKDFLAYGGHLLDLEVSTGSMEITLLRHEKRLERVLDSCTGANVLGL
jgi:uncharacterized protein